MSTDQQAQAPPKTGQQTEAPVDLSKMIEYCESAIYSHVPHPHLWLRHREGPIKVLDQMDRSTPMARLNSRLALIITLAVGSMWAAYLFAVLAFVSFPSAIKSGNTIIIVAWIAQTFLQLVLLPVIIVGQNIQGKASDKRAEQTYNDAESILHEALQIQRHLALQDAQLEAQQRQMKEIIASLQQAYPAVGGSTPAPSE